MHLRYDLVTAFLECDEERHAQDVMRELGIIYQHSTPQTLGDQWWFWNCQNVPTTLPTFLTELDMKPHDAIGFGLSKEDADRIVNG